MTFFKLGFGLLWLAVTESRKGSSMERKSLMSSSLRDHSIKGSSGGDDKMMMMMVVVKDPIRNCNKSQEKQSCGGGEDHNNVGFSWPPRCYACSFCKREFRSAQALGGHMNVHRRDAGARLRQSPPRDHNLNLNLSPSPNPNSSTSLNEWVSPRAVKKSKFLKTNVGLSLEIGHSKEDLDLELRLGYP